MSREKDSKFCINFWNKFRKEAIQNSILTLLVKFGLFNPYFLLLLLFWINFPVKNYVSHEVRYDTSMIHYSMLRYQSRPLG